MINDPRRAPSRSANAPINSRSTQTLCFDCGHWSYRPHYGYDRRFDASCSPILSLGCDLAAIKTARELHEGLGHRAVEIVAAAAATGSAADARLQRLVDQSASFSLGAGDVGRPLGMGPTGARSLAAEMKADQYRFLGWDYMDGPADACGKHSITVEFVDSIDRLVSQIEFSFDRGQIIAAKGWQRSFESGPLPATAAAHGS